MKRSIPIGIFGLAILVSCKNVAIPDLVPLVSVEYRGNGNTSGEAPVDPDEYLPGSEINILGPGFLARQGYSFGGWNTLTDGTGTAYIPGPVEIPAGGLVLQAQWIEDPYNPTPPNNGTTTATTPLLTWTDPSGTDVYDLQISTSYSFDPLSTSLYDNIIECSFQIEERQTNGKTLFWRIRRSDINGFPGEWSSIWVFQIRIPAPPLVSPANNAVITENTILMEWIEVAPGFTYDAWISRDPNFGNPYTTEMVFDIDASYYRNTTILKDGRRYYWKVRTKTPDGTTGDWSESRSVQVDLSPPRPIFPVPNGSVETLMPRLKWEEISYAESYEVQVDDDIWFVPPIEEKTGLTDTEYQITVPLKDSTVYYWRARIIDQAGDPGEWTSALTFSVDLPRPEIFDPYGGSSLADTTPILAWNTVSEATKYQLEVHDNPGFSGTSFVDEPALVGTTYTLSVPLADNTTYYWRVRYIDSDGTLQGWATDSFRIDIAPPKILQPGINRGFYRYGTKTLSWTPVESITAYHVEISRSADFDVEPAMEESAITGSELTLDSNFTEVRKYYWRIRSRNVDGIWGDWSPTMTLNIALYGSWVLHAEDTDFGSGILQNAAGNLITVGGSAPPESNPRSLDVLFWESDVQGKIIQQYSFGGNGIDLGGEVLQTRDGDYLVSGTTTSWGGGMDDLWLVKISRNGIILWQEVFGGTDLENPGEVIETSDGGYLIAGTTRSYQGIYVNGWLLKVGSDGTMEWQSHYGGDNHGWFYGVEETSDGYLIAGQITMTGDLAGGWLMKTDFYGHVQWEKYVTSGGPSRFSGIDYRSDGTFTVTAGVDYDRNNYWKLWILNLNSEGTVLQENRYITADRMSIDSTAIRGDDSAVVTGTLSVPGETRNSWMMRIASNGNLDWARKYGEGGSDLLYDVVNLGSGYAVTGQNYSSKATASSGPEVWMAIIGSDGDCGSLDTALNVLVATTPHIVKDISTLEEAITEGPGATSALLRVFPGAVSHIEP